MRDFPGGPVVKTLCASTAGAPGSIPGRENKILHAIWPKKPKKHRGNDNASIICISHIVRINELSHVK